MLDVKQLSQMSRPYRWLRLVLEGRKSKKFCSQGVSPRTPYTATLAPFQNLSNSEVHNETKCLQRKHLHRFRRWNLLGFHYFRALHKYIQEAIDDEGQQISPPPL